MTGIRLLLIIFGAVCCTPAVAQAPLVAHREDVLDWRHSSAAADGGGSASFAAFGRRFDVVLERNRRVEMRVGVTGTARAYRGTLRDRPGSWARIVVSDTGPAGMIWDGATLYGLTSGGGRSPATIFRADDVIIPAGTMTCGVHQTPNDAGAMFAALRTEVPEVARAIGATLNLNLGVVADSDFAALHLDPAAAMLERVNNIDGIYSEQVGVQITVEQIDVFSDTASDPFTDTGDAETLLGELAVYRGSTPAQDAQGLTHLFTGRNLDGSTVGLAYIGAVCAQRSIFDPEDRSFGAGLTQADGGIAGALIESLVAAHEIGHNFGAPHDGEEGECLSAPPGYLMSPSLNITADRFSQCSVDVITNGLASLDCLTPIPGVDVAIDGSAGTPAPLTETAFDYTIEVRNYGSDTAADTTVELSFDPAFSVLAAAPQSGTCSAPQHEMLCDLGAVPGTASRTIAVTLRSDTPGDRDIAGSVTATADANAANDAFTDMLSVTLASDLAIVAAPQRLMPGESVLLGASLENRSGFPASDVFVDGTVTGDIRLDAVDVAGAACAVATTQLAFECRIAELGPFTDSVVNVTLTGATAGSAALNLTVGAQQPDPVAANNAVSIALTIVAEGSNDDDSGGGSLGALSMLALLLAGAIRKRRQKANFS